MEILKKVIAEYKELYIQGCSHERAAKGALELLDTDPYIYEDRDGFPSYFYYKDYIIFFSGSIYKEEKL